MQDERRLNVRTLVIASIASAAAALITSQFWIRGTPIAAALTPIIVTLVSELLHRPTEKIAQRMTVETDALPEAAGAEPPPPSEETAPRPAPDTDFKVYRAGSMRRKRIAWATVLTTGLLGGSLAANLRVDNPLFSHTLFSIYLGVAVWVALWLREEKIRGVFPLVK